MTSLCPAITLSSRDYDAVLFDLDGVLTRTASVHAAAWKRLFDEFLEQRSAETNAPFLPFDIDADYRRYVDGKPRYDGVAAFLKSRGIELPSVASEDGSGMQTIDALGDQKDTYFLEYLKLHGVESHEASIILVRTLRRIKTAVVSSSNNCAVVLEAAGTTQLFDVRVGRWARQFLPSGGSIGTFELLTRITQGINHALRYRRREMKGIQQPVETLRLGHGCCRDFAVLMIEAAGSLGLAARFASGYLAVPLDDPEDAMRGSARGSTHAWAQIYLPGIGWLDFDPTRGSVGKIGLVMVAVVRDPRHALPLHGTFFGFSSDHLDMQVRVSVTSGTPEAISATPQRSRFGQPV
jgi:transglutaminase-like putative cysteine protease